MMGRLILVLVAVPIIELALLIEVGRHIGTWQVIALIVVTALVGATLTRIQGFGVIHRVRHDLQMGAVPAESLIDGIMILIGGILLIAPGLITDTIGFVLLVPRSRNIIKAWLARKLRHWIEDGSIRFFIR